MLQRKRTKNRHDYNAAFYAYTEERALRSALTVLPLVCRFFRPRSVVDFGCGTGAWLAVWTQLGVVRCVGVDGDTLDAATLRINKDDFVVHDLCEPLDLHEEFDLVQSLEVAEHLPAASAEIFVDTLVRHGKVVLFSAACLGDGGLHHVNERPYDYWRDLFDKRDFVLLDALRPLLRNEHNVETWYRYNTFIVVARDLLETLPKSLTETVVFPTQHIPDISPLGYRMRKRIVQLLPVSVVTRLAVIKQRITWLRRQWAPTYTASAVRPTAVDCFERRGEENPRSIS